MRLPNGFGTVYKMKGSRRRPWIARKTLGFTNTGKQKWFTIGTYETKKEAMCALVKFNENPYDVKQNKLTFEDLYNRFKTESVDKLSKSAQNGYNAAFKHCSPIHKKIFAELKASDLQRIVDTCDKSYETKRKIKVLLKGVYKYAMKNDIVAKDYSEFIELGKRETTIERKPFTDAEIKRLFDVEPEISMVDTILILIYTGFRISELLDIKTENVNLEGGTLTGGLKTEAGKNRIVPISHKILPLIEKRYNPDNKFLITNRLGRQMKYSNYVREYFEPIMEQLDMDHKTHDCRHTWFTLMDKAGANKVAIKKIGGHASYQTSEKVYTHKDIEDLKEAIELL